MQNLSNRIFLNHALFIINSLDEWEYSNFPKFRLERLINVLLIKYLYPVVNRFQLDFSQLFQIEKRT